MSIKTELDLNNLQTDVDRYRDFFEQTEDIPGQKPKSQGNVDDFAC